MKVLIASQADGDGGAARAAYRLHRALLGSGVTSRMLVDNRTTDDATVFAAGSRRGAVRAASRQGRAYAERAILELQRPADMDYRTVGVVPGPSGGVLRRTTADVVNVHWIGAGYLSIPQLSRVTKPMMWTLHDMWPFCGAEHYAPDVEHARWRTGYDWSNRHPASTGLDLDRYAWQLKRLMLRRKIQLVTPSQWLADCVRSSALFGGWPCAVIPNAVPTDVFRPHPKPVARQVFGLAPDVPLIAFGAPGGTRDPRKGWDLLEAALPIVAERVPNAQAVIFGQSAPPDPPRVGMPLHYVGRLRDDTSLALLYSAADVMVVPSRQENLPQTATEAQACGTPVVVFGATGTRDTVEDLRTGRIVPDFDVGGLAQAVVASIRDDEWCAAARDLSRRVAVAKWAPENIASKFLDVADGVREVGAR